MVTRGIRLKTMNIVNIPPTGGRFASVVVLLRSMLQ